MQSHGKCARRSCFYQQTSRTLDPPLRPPPSLLLLYTKNEMAGPFNPMPMTFYIRLKADINIGQKNVTKARVGGVVGAGRGAV